MNYPQHLLKLIESLKKLPGVGSRTAERFAFDLLNWKQNHLQEFSQLLSDIPKKLCTCSECGCLKGEEACLFCTKERERVSTLCILATPRDAFSIEATQEFKGLYHVLGTLISPLEGIGPEQLNLEKLIARIHKHAISEVVIALDSTIEGDATALYLKMQLASLPVQVSRLAFGMPMGSSIDYVDGGTLARALAGRSKF